MDYTNWFMTNDEARLHRVFAFQNMQVRTANRCERYANYSFAGPGPRNWNLLDCDLIRAAKNEGSHGVRAFFIFHWGL
jgi:hypothetical protein